MASNTNIFGIPTSSTSNNLDDLVNKALNETSYGIIDTSNDDSSNNELEEESNIFEELVDYTDPIVMFDPEVKKAVIVKSNEEQNTDGNITGAINEDRDSTKVEGIYYPIIKINNLLVNTLEELVDMTIELNSFYPTVKILVRDDNYKFLDDPPGMNNSGITVVCIPEFPEKYRKISLTFDIKSCFRVSDGTYDYMKYYGVYKMLFFEQNVLLGLSRDSLEEINKEIEENQQKQQEEEDNKDYKIIRIYGEEFKVDKNSPVTEKSDLNDICEAEIAYEEKHSESNSYSEMLDEISSLISSSLTNDHWGTQTDLKTGVGEITATTSVKWFYLCNKAMLWGCILSLLTFFSTRLRLTVTYITAVVAGFYYVLVVYYALKLADLHYTTLYPNYMIVLPAVVCAMMILVSKNIIKTQVDRIDREMETYDVE